MSGDQQLQIRLVTDRADLSVPGTTLSVPSKIGPEGLTSLLRSLLAESCPDQDDLESKTFEFVLLSDLIRAPLEEFLSDKDSLSSESVLEISYFESRPAPKPQKSFSHDDWVSGLSCRGNFVLSACYDHTVNIFDVRTGEKKLTIPGHGGPVRDVVWLSLDDSVGTFASCSHDQIVMLYRWNVSDNSVEAMNACKGHERSVDCLAVAPGAKYLASGSFDTTLKIWGTQIHSEAGGETDEDKDGESESKKAKGDSSHGSSKTLTRTPVMTLAGHKEGISGVDWTENPNELITASWDHTLKVWDMEMGGMKSELVSNKSFFDLSYSAAKGLIVTASADKAIRTYDPRSKDGVIVRSQHTSHAGWITCVDWCKTDDNHFISGSHDMILKMWDVRSCKTPLYDLKGHEERVLCCDWSETRFVASGGADNGLKVFQSNVK